MLFQAVATAVRAGKLNLLQSYRYRAIQDYLIPAVRWSAEREQMLTKYKERIDYLHFGHVHASIHGTCCGIPFASVPSTGNQSIPDLKETRWLKGAPLEPIYYVIQIQGWAGQRLFTRYPIITTSPFFHQALNGTTGLNQVAVEA